jgi:hypothetical protein
MPFTVTQVGFEASRQAFTASSDSDSRCDGIRRIEERERDPRSYTPQLTGCWIWRSALKRSG